MLSVQTNVSAISAQRHLGATSNALGTAMERLSSGFRINRAADDAAGLAVSEKLKAQIGGLNQASRNSQDGISMIQTAEGALDEVQSMMQRMRDLAVQASSDTNSQTERDNINLELGQLGKEINSISIRTKFNGQSMLNGSLVTDQMTAANGYGGTTTELLASTTAGILNAANTATNAFIAFVAVADAQSAKGYQFSSDVTNTSAPTITLTQVDTNGATTGVAQTIVVSSITAGQSEYMDFSDLGVKLNISTAAAGGNVTAVDLATAFTGGSNFSVDTATGSGTAVLQTGANQGDETSIAFVNTRLSGTTGVAAMDALSKALTNFQSSATRENASAMITALDGALGSISSSRATLGAAQNRLQHTIANLGTSSENLSASNSRIRDVDVATESSNMAKNQVLEQAGVSVLAQANQLPQLALKLLG
jgi:flagellin